MTAHDGPSSGSDSRKPDADGGVWTWLLPALTFLVGALLATGLFLVGDTVDDDEDDDAGSSAAPTSSPSPSPDPLVVQVPAACVEAAELADSVTSALGAVTAAARDFDARRLQETLDVVQQLRPEVEAASRECRDLAAEGSIVTPSDPPTATPRPAPTATATTTSSPT